MERYFWERPDLNYKSGSLFFAERDVSVLCGYSEVPAFFYSADRICKNITRIKGALENTRSLKLGRIYFALKANRFMPLVSYIRRTGLCGIDACSPREVEWAVSCGFLPEDISFTASSLSDHDYGILNRFKGLHVNCDSLQTIRKWGELNPGTNIGIRINPAAGIGRTGNEKLHYSGSDTTKFGIYKEQFNEAIYLARKYKLNVTKIHFHTGCGYLNDQLKTLEGILKESLWFIDQAKTITTVNIGGGLGVPHTEKDESLDLVKWAEVISQAFKGRDLAIEVEPGDYIAKDAGILLLKVNYVEQKKDRMFAGLNAGFNIALEPAVYSMPFEPVLVSKRKGKYHKYTIAGNINEALDIWYKDISMPQLKEGDDIALINAGAYSSSMSSNHCIRGEFKEFLLD